MCNPIRIARPADLLADGKHYGYEWEVIANGLGFRCGYVRLPAGHPWHGESYDDIDCDVHGGLTFAAADEPCDKRGADNGYWLGFDCGHGGDAPDPTLAIPPFYAGFYGTIKDTNYVRKQCHHLIDQAHESALAAG